MMGTETEPTELAVSEDILEGEDMLNLEDLDEKEVLGDDEEEKISTVVTKKEQLDGDDLYDAAIEPSGALNEKHESAEIQSSLPSSVERKQVYVKSEPGTGSQREGKRYCCYIGNMTWWTTDSELEKLINTLGVEDLVDIKFYENRNNGQSKGFALAVFASEPSVKILMEKLPNKKLYDQALVVLPYTKQSMAKLEDATKRFDQKGSNIKEEKVVNIGTIRIGANGAPVPQLMSSINLAQLARPVSHQQQQAAQQPTSLLSLNFANPPVVSAAGTGGLQLQQQPQRPPQAASVGGGMVAVSSVPMAPTTAMPPPGTQSLLGQPAAAAAAAVQVQQQQMAMAAAAAAAQAAAAQQQSAAAAAMLMQQQQQRPQQPTAQQQALQQAMSRPPPSLPSLGMTAAPPPINMAAAMMPTAGGAAAMMHHQQQQQSRPMSMQMPGATMQAAQGLHQHHPGFPPGAHINPQVYPGFATHGAYGSHPENGSMMSEAEFQEIMNRNQTVSSSAIHRAVSDAAGGDYSSAIETLVTAISLIRQSRVAHDERCKLLVNTLQDTLNGIEAKSYSTSSRKHRRERSRSPIRTSSKRHRRSPRSRSRSRDRGYDYSPGRHSISRRY